MEALLEEIKNNSEIIVKLLERIDRRMERAKTSEYDIKLLERIAKSTEILTRKP